MLHWMYHWMGIDNTGGIIYAFWSGFGSDLGEFAIFWGLFANYKKHVCHVDHPRFCWRIGTHPVAGTPYRVCKRHHPDVPELVSIEAITAAASTSTEGEPNDDLRT